MKNLYSIVMFIIPIVIVVAALIAYFLYKHYYVVLLRNKQLKSMVDHRGCYLSLLQNSPYYSQLPPDEQKKYLEKILIFIADKKWIENLDKNKKFTIASKAALPIINRKTNFYPTIQEGFENYSQEDWFNLHIDQFENECGKMALHNMEGEFSTYVSKYFFESEKLSKEKPEIYKNLRFYFNKS